MRNLAIHQLRRRSVEFMKNNAEENVRDIEQSAIHCAIDPNYLGIYVLLNNRIYIIPMEANSDITSINLPGYKKCLSGYSRVVGLEYCITMQELYCAYESGAIARLDISNQDNLIYEIVATFDNNLECMKLSPDNEIITVVTRRGTVITMVSGFQIISEVDLYERDFGEKQFITVGWGKKETQFHGSAGKAAAKAKPEELNVNEFDDSRPRISWRGDGTLFAVSFLHIQTNIRQFKIFDRKGTLYYTSEPINGLEECLAWQPLGNLIATTQKLANKHVVALFEKNGLKYTEFPLSFPSGEITQVKDLLWSPNSDVLAVICEGMFNHRILQLWTENNCQWYLKQTIVFSTDNPLIYATWSTIGRYDQKDLILLTLKEIMFCSFNWCVNHSRGKTVDDNTVIAVIDGKKTLVTGFRNGILPPPMAHQCLQIQEPVNSIAFAPTISHNTSLLNSNMFCTISCDNRLTFFKQITDSSSLRYETLQSFDIDRSISFITGIHKCVYATHHFLWLAEDVMLFSITMDKRNFLCVLSLDEIHFKGNGILPMQKFYAVDNSIEYIIPSLDENTAYIIVDRAVFKYTIDAEDLIQTNVFLRELCYQVEVIKIDSKDVIIALSCTNCFSIDGKEIAKNITSFYVHSDFLLLTTQQHTLICVPLNKSGVEQLSKHDLTVKPWEDGSNEISFTDIYIRRVEKDSYIIAALPQDSKTILQMPRGNLECIEPRALSLHILKSHLDNCNYRIAFDIMRKQRINLNLIYDHDPKLFMDNAERFVEEIAKPYWLSLFLSELQDEDVTSTMYANCYPNRSVATSGNNETKVNKVNEICKLLTDIMEKQQNAVNLIQPILMSLLKNHEQGLEKALEKVKQVKILEDSEKLILPAHYPSSTSAEDALKHLLHFVNIDVLYDTALGMYDFELTMFVASMSSKDPKEYIPFLNSLKKLNKDYMRYSIDMHLKRYESALKHISRDSSKFEECFNLVHDQKLYSKAMKLFKKGSMEYKKIAGAYGEFLLSKAKYQEAGIMFYKSGDLNRALKAFSIVGDGWQDAIAVAREMKLSSRDLHELYELLVKRLEAQHNYEAAATILKHYLNDAEKAVALLCKGQYYKFAIRTAYDFQRLDLCETYIIPEVTKHTEYVMLKLDAYKENFLKHKSRLALVRAEIYARQTRPFDESIYHESLFGKEIMDSLSETSSIAGSVSSKSGTSTASKSYRSSKNRRKLERKLLSLKKGSTFEDIGLIHALYHIITDVYKNKDEWFQLIPTLLRFEFDECAEKLHIEIKNLFQLMENSKSEIWDKSAPTSLAEIEKMTIYTPAQMEEITAPIKLVERYIKHPPETDTISCVLDIF